jgi:histidinol dehydrogenase
MKLAIEKPISELTSQERLQLLDRKPSDEPQLRKLVQDILERIRADQDEALFAMARDFDKVELKSLEVPRRLWEEALASLDPELRQDLQEAARNIQVFHEAQIPQEIQVTVRPGVTLGRRAIPLTTVGVYAPGGLAAYPSSVLMGVVPAVAAGVETIILCSPPGPDGLPPREVMAAALLGGASRLFAVGGAGAIGAMAFGTPTIPPVDAIVGPGNRFVTEAKRQVAGDVLIDSPAGPSEVLVVADEAADPRLCALELVCQAEHDPDAAVALVTDSSSLLARVRASLEEEVARAPRRDIVEMALARQGALLLAESREDALAFARAYAAEHLALFTQNPKADMESAQTAGTVFLGQAAAVAYGDYITGANHVLPTGGLARSFSSLSTQHYLRMYTWQDITPEAAASMSDAVERMAESEGLPAHAEAARARRPLS